MTSPQRHLIATLTLLAPLVGCATLAITSEPVDVEIEHLLTAIDDAVEISYNSSSDNASLEFKSVSVSVETILDVTESGDVTVSVLTIDAYRDTDSAQTVTVTLKAPETASEHDEGQTVTPPSGLVKSMVKAIDAALAAAHGVKAGLHSIHPDGIPFEASTIAVTTSFAVTGSLTGTPSITLFGITLGPKRTRENLHSVTLTFNVKSSDDGSSESSGSSS